MSKPLVASAVAAALIAASVATHAVAAQSQPPLPEGKGKPLVEALCASCHALQLINNSTGYTREQWRELTGYMVDMSGSAAQMTEVLDYLEKNFPPGDTPRRAAKVVPGKFQVAWKEYAMSKLGQRTRDPVQAADGSIWYAGQYGNIIGRYDLKTGQTREYDLPPNSMPHTVQLDPKGRPW